MLRVSAVVLGFAVVLGGSAVGAAESYPLHIRGVDIRAIQTAMPHFNSMGRSIDEYDVTVVEKDGVVVVHFSNRGVPPSMRGCPEEWPHYEVALKKDRVTILRAGRYYCR